MVINLNLIKDKKDINEVISFEKETLSKTNIRALDNINVNGCIFYNDDNILELSLSIKGIMILADTITLEDIEYPFDIKIDEIIDENNEDIKEYFQKKQNRLDIMGILWQNIVLEVPIRITKSESNSLKGEGWELKVEKDIIDPRLAPLQELLETDFKEGEN